MSHGSELVPVSTSYVFDRAQELGVERRIPEHSQHVTLRARDEDRVVRALRTHAIQLRQQSMAELGAPVWPVLFGPYAFDRSIPPRPREARARHVHAQRDHAFFPFQPDDWRDESELLGGIQL